MWVNSAAQSEGLSDTEALARAGAISGVAQTCALIAGPFIGMAGRPLLVR